MGSTSQKPIPHATYAVILKVYVWNAFVARQVGRIVETVGSGDVWVLVDESRGRVEGITHPLVLRVTEDDAVRQGLARAKTGDSLFWYCSDYLHHLFLDAHPEYTHYITIEHDVVAKIDLDAFANSLAADAVDYVGIPIQTPRDAYPWLAGLLTIYGADELKLDLYCFAAFSNRAMRMLRAKRIEMSQEFANGSLPFWPIGEAFVPTEVERAGLQTRRLDDYGDRSRYDWWPPFHEDDVHSMPTPSFAHPVLEGSFYIRNVLRHESLSGLMHRGSSVRKRLERYGLRACLPHIVREVRRRSLEAARRRLERFGIVSRWTAGIETPTPPVTVDGTAVRSLS